MGDTYEPGLLSLMRDATSRAALEKYMVAHGVDPSTAREASVRCEKAAIKNGALGAAAMGLLGLFATAPVAGLGAPAAMTLGMVVGTGGTLLFSKQCQEVQDAAFRIVNDLD
jgi:hypothetical protein